MSSAGNWDLAARQPEQDAEMRAGAQHAAGLIHPGVIVGLAPGGTADFALHYLAGRLTASRLQRPASPPARTSTNRPSP
ncbi:hypothetical protein [Streptomyces sp. NPDC005969]|uniref:hypothetical protein n=1 Tax=Streptomyces sp. NPDC005969 TaxID=3156722 RepID=UPI0033C2AA43